MGTSACSRAHIVEVTTTLSNWKLISDLPYSANVVPSFLHSISRLERSETSLLCSGQPSRKKKKSTAPGGMFRAPLLDVLITLNHIIAPGAFQLSEFRENITLSMARGAAQIIVIGHFASYLEVSAKSIMYGVKRRS